MSGLGLGGPGLLPAAVVMVKNFEMLLLACCCGVNAMRCCDEDK